MGVRKDRWEVGSEFAWSDCFADTEKPWPLSGPRQFFATGRAALIALGQKLSPNTRLRLFVPTYFCPQVSASLKPWFKLHFFVDLPAESGPRLDTLKANAGDLVLAVNFFGTREQGVWNEYLASSRGVILVEDHTHDPFSPWAQRSRAPYAFSSLRKTLPVSDGAVLWSPEGQPLPAPPLLASPGSYWKFEAMVLKSAYLKGAPVKKEDFRRLQIDGENELEKNTGGSVCDLTRIALPLLPVRKLRQKRARNVKDFLKLIDGGGRPFSPLFTEWPKGGAPFGVVLLCNSTETREKLLAWLVANNIYPPVHWRIPATSTISQGLREHEELSSRLLTIPVDHRLNPADVERVASIVASFSE